ncbi:mitochondrial ribonuclease P protein 1 homolog [Nesidiocoris tenuis]|nr:mitochondrial ribonuclease P protein 1 homolog [Nesidiocoris tenuis]
MFLKSRALFSIVSRSANIFSPCVSRRSTRPVLLASTVIVRRWESTGGSQSGKNDDLPGIFENIDYEALSNGDAEMLKKIKLIALEMDVARQEGLPMPSAISMTQWQELLCIPSRTQRLKTLRFWFLNEMKKAGDKAKKVRKREARLAKLEAQLNESEPNNHITYGFAGSTIFLRVYDSTMDRWKNSRLIESMIFGQPLVIDCSYDEFMTIPEANNTALQLSYVFADNRAHASPFNLHLCKAYKQSRTITRLHKMIPPMYNDDFPLNVSEKSYLDLFPKERLVYLTPHCRDTLQEYNHDDVYIVGAMVDKSNCDPHSLAKAKADGIRMAKLPLERNLDWGFGSKSLTINQVVSILLDMKVTNCWKKALAHVPQRKIKHETESPKVFEGPWKKPEFRNKIISKQQRKMLRIHELYS